MGTGIDYGLGRTNIDTATGIRYGVISQRLVTQAWADSAEPDYGDQADDDDAEPVGWSYDGDGYVLTDCLDTDIMVLKSPYFTYAPFCSPCVPGAGSLDEAEGRAEGTGVKTYCLGHDWFEEGRAPYPVFKVADGEKVEV